MGRSAVMAAPPSWLLRSQAFDPRSRNCCGADEGSGVWESSTAARIYETARRRHEGVGRGLLDADLQSVTSTQGQRNARFGR